VLLGYLEYFRSVLVDRLADLPAAELRGSRLPPGWTPLQLIKHLAVVELRWMVWGSRVRTSPTHGLINETRPGLARPSERVDQPLASLRRQAGRTPAVVLAHALDEVGRPGEWWDGAEPATLERVLLHLLQGLPDIGDSTSSSRRFDVSHMA
jgi:hypothetical protein